MRSVKKIETDLKDVMKQIIELTDTFSDLRFEMLDRAEERQDEDARKKYNGWTRRVHLKLGDTIEEYEK